ncbi:unnamed protein product [Closterium sp. NIES-65]|nr:unnamed protein product [Closterium sp. NIES-65]
MADAKPQTLRAWLHSAVESRGDVAAIVVTQGGPTVTHAALEAAVDGVAAQLRALGVRPGDLVSLAFPNSLEFVILFLAVTRVRATAAPLNAAYTEEEFKFYMEDAQARLLLLPEGGTPKAQAAAAALGVPVAHAGSYGGEEGVPLSPLPGLCTLPHARIPNGNPFLSSSHPPLEGVPLRPSEGLSALPPADIPDGPGPGPTPDPADVALFLHTSGTTSRPKGVPLTHANLAASIGNIIDTYDLTSADRSYLVMPLFHVHGLMAALLASLSSGGSVVLPASGRFSASTFWDEVVQSGATWYTAVPTMHQILLSRHRSHGPPTLSGKSQGESQGESLGESTASVTAYPPLRFIRSCSASLAAAVLEEMETVFGAPVLEAYAMTEASHQMTANPLPSKGSHKAGSVGLPTGIELAILDEQGRELGVGERGEVCIRGANVTAGYRSNPAANEAAFAFGWFHTGDEGKRDEEGYLYLTGRLKELINRGGEKISPLEVDAALLAVKGVAEAVAFSAPDAHYGEEVSGMGNGGGKVNAAVVLEPGVSLTQEEVQEHLKNHLAAFKLPKRVFFVDHLPRTATGKIQRRFVAQAMLSGEGTAAAPAAASAAPAAAAPSPSPSATLDAPALIALSLARLGVTHLFGVIGIPVTAVATAAQQQGIRFLSFRNEQAAGYAAAAYGYLTGTPGVLLTVSGPGCVHALAGVSHAQVNTWPLLLLSGSCTQEDVGQGDFQELDQVRVVRPFVKESGRAKSIAEIPGVVKRAAEATVAGRPGGAYVDLPADVLHGSISEEDARKLLEDVKPLVPLWCTALDPSAPLASALESSLTEAIALLREAKAPLLVVGKGAAYAHAENQIAALVELTGIPFLPTPMGKGVLSDTHPLCISAARSLALSQADVALVVGARLNWILHFGQPPKWAAGVKFVLVDVDESEVAQRRPAVGLVGDARAVVGRLAARWAAEGGQKVAADNPWVSKLKVSKPRHVKLRLSCTRPSCLSIPSLVPIPIPLTPLRPLTHCMVLAIAVLSLIAWCWPLPSSHPLHGVGHCRPLTHCMVLAIAVLSPIAWCWPLPSSHPLHGVGHCRPLTHCMVLAIAVLSPIAWCWPLPSSHPLHGVGHCRPLTHCMVLAIAVLSPIAWCWPLPSSHPLHGVGHCRPLTHCMVLAIAVLSPIAWCWPLPSSHPLHGVGHCRPLTHCMVLAIAVLSPIAWCWPLPSSHPLHGVGHCRPLTHCMVLAIAILSPIAWCWPLPSSHPLHGVGHCRPLTHCMVLAIAVLSPIAWFWPLPSSHPLHGVGHCRPLTHCMVLAIAVLSPIAWCWPLPSSHPLHGVGHCRPLTHCMVLAIAVLSLIAWCWPLPSSHPLHGVGHCRPLTHCMVLTIANPMDLGRTLLIAPLPSLLLPPSPSSRLLLPSIQAKASANSVRMESLLSQDAHPLNFHCSLRVLRDKLAALPPSITTLLCSEGANTMDMGRTVLPQLTPRSRLDAATWGTMGVGLGYAVAAAVAPLGEERESGGSGSEGGEKGKRERLVVALEGDSAFGFSGMEIETMVRYNLPIIVVVMNNGGIYGGDRRGPVQLPDSTRSDPPPTSFVEGARYDRMMEAFGGRGYHVTTVQELGAALEQAFKERKPAVVNVVVDPLAGAESGRLTHKN